MAVACGDADGEKILLISNCSNDDIIFCIHGIPQCHKGRHPLYNIILC